MHGLKTIRRYGAPFMLTFRQVEVGDANFAETTTRDRALQVATL